jgi:hypothetical protein
MKMLATWMKRCTATLLTLLVIATIATYVAPKIHAAGDTGTATLDILVGAPMGSIGAISIPPVTMDGNDQTKTFPVAITVNVPAGNMAWHLTFATTSFAKNGGGTLDANATLRIINCAYIGGGPLTNTVNSYPINVLATQNTFFGANKGANAGDNVTGSFTVTPSFELMLPSTVLPGTYTSTFTVGTVTGI